MGQRPLPHQRRHTDRHLIVLQIHMLCQGPHGGRTGPPDPTTRSFWAYGTISVVKAFHFGNKILRMAGIVQMLHARIQPSDKYLLMPTEREHSEHNPEHKRDHHPARRLRFLDHSVPDVGGSLILRVIVCTLALYGLYSVFF